MTCMRYVMRISVDSHSLLSILSRFSVDCPADPAPYIFARLPQCQKLSAPIKRIFQTYMELVV